MMMTAAKIHAVLKKAGITKSQVNISKMVRGYHTHSDGYYLSVEKTENPNWGINSYKRSQYGRWLSTGRIFIGHTDNSRLEQIAKVLSEAGIPYEVESNFRIIAGEANN